MLIHLHVKNLALIREAQIDFTEGLNIFTGETGAGKSILIGAVEAALGDRGAKEMVREGADYGLAELVFEVTRESQRTKLAGLGYEPEDGEVVISRKFVNGRSINRINGESVPLSVLKAAAELLIDVHGQHEHQSLLKKKKHLEILDEFAGEELLPVKEGISESRRSYLKLKAELEGAAVDQESRLREIALLEYEIQEIEGACLTPGEDGELERLFQKMTNAYDLRRSAGCAYALTGYENGGGGAAIGQALRELSGAAACDGELEGLLSQLMDLDGLLNDFNRELSDYLSSLEFDDEEFSRTEKRLDLINGLKAKYGRTIDEVLAYAEKQKERLNTLKNYDEYLDRLNRDISAEKERLDALCADASRIRKKYSSALCREIRGHLEDLNFHGCSFEVEFGTLKNYTADGTDDVEFVISTNPGEPLKPLSKVASGGELSRIMLAIKTVLADRDDIDAVIFDEIDTGISGRTAQKVAEKMMLISRSRQVICITHLAQIAAFADSHFRIEKEAAADGTRTLVDRLGDDECVEELARMLGGAEITKAVRENAAEMKRLADKKKFAQI